MKPKQIWMAIVNDTDEGVFKKICQTQRKAEHAIVAYLCEHEGFDGKDFRDACFWIGEKDLRLDLMVFPMQPEDFKAVWDRLAMFRSDLPLREKGLYRVIYEIDVGAGSAIEAAEQVHQIMTDSQSLPPVLDVIDNKRNKIRMDLSQRKKKGQSMADKKINLAQLLYTAYPHADLLPLDPHRDCRNLETLLARVTRDEIGDGLFRFIVVEIVEGGESTLAGAIRVMQRASEDIEAVSRVLRTTANKDAIANDRPAETTEAAWQSNTTLQEQAPEFPSKNIKLHLLAEDGQLWIRPQGYGEKCTEDGEGSPVGMEIWEDRLRLIVFDDINTEEPRIIDLENARETCRLDPKEG